jgi:hypothetical protein
VDCIQAFAFSGQADIPACYSSREFVALITTPLCAAKSAVYDDAWAAVERGLNAYIAQMTQHAPKKLLQFSWSPPAAVVKAIDLVRALKPLVTYVMLCWKKLVTFDQRLDQFLAASQEGKNSAERQCEVDWMVVDCRNAVENEIVKESPAGEHVNTIEEDERFRDEEVNGIKEEGLLVDEEVNAIKEEGLRVNEEVNGIQEEGLRVNDEVNGINEDGLIVDDDGNAIKGKALNAISEFEKGVQSIQSMIVADGNESEERPDLSSSNIGLRLIQVRIHESYSVDESGRRA